MEQPGTGHTFMKLDFFLKLTSAIYIKVWLKLYNTKRHLKQRPRYIHDTLPLTRYINKASKQNTGDKLNII
jgi:hypothetical protein